MQKQLGGLPRSSYSLNSVYSTDSALSSTNMGLKDPPKLWDVKMHQWEGIPIRGKFDTSWCGQSRSKSVSSNYINIEIRFSEIKGFGVNLNMRGWLVRLTVWGERSSKVDWWHCEGVAISTKKKEEPNDQLCGCLVSLYWPFLRTNLRQIMLFVAWTRTPKLVKFMKKLILTWSTKSWAEYSTGLQWEYPALQ